MNRREVGSIDQISLGFKVLYPFIDYHLKKLEFWIYLFKIEM